MLIESKFKNEKIVQGLLSYATSELQLSISDLTALIEDYRRDDHAELYLYKLEENDNFIGIVGIDKHFNHEESSELESIHLHHFALIPSFRNEGVGYQMFRELKALYPNAALLGSLNTSDIIVKFSEKFRLEQ